MSITHPALVVASTALVIGGATACSGETTALAVSAVVARVNAICVTYAKQVEALPAPSFSTASVTSAQLSATARYLDRSVPLLQTEQDRIEAVEKPRADSSLFNSVLAALAAHVRDQEAARVAAHARNLPSFRAAVASDNRDATHLAGVAQQFGLNKCI